MCIRNCDLHSCLYVTVWGPTVRTCVCTVPVSLSLSLSEGNTRRRKVRRRGTCAPREGVSLCVSPVRESAEAASFFSSLPWMCRCVCVTHADSLSNKCCAILKSQIIRHDTQNCVNWKGENCLLKTCLLRFHLAINFGDKTPWTLVTKILYL